MSHRDNSPSHTALYGEALTGQKNCHIGLFTLLLWFCPRLSYSRNQ